MDLEKALKSGYKTTEFWLSLAAVVAGIVQMAAADTVVGRIAGAIVTVLISMGYAGLRTSAKKTGKDVIDAATQASKSAMGEIAKQALAGKKKEKE